MKNRVSLIIGCVFLFFMGFSLTIIQDVEANSAMMGSCGSGMECYSVPDGCGVGVGCKRTFCTLSDCPGGVGGYDEYCFYCADPE